MSGDSTVTWRPGIDPCPACGNVEPHETTFGGPEGGFRCGPTESERVMAEHASALWAGFAAATLYVPAEGPLRDQYAAHLANLEATIALRDGHWTDRLRTPAEWAESRG